MIVLTPYEMPLAILGSLEEAKAKMALEVIKKLITEAKGEVASVEEWGKKILPYAHQKETSAQYFLINFEADQKVISAIDQKLRRQEELMRFLIIKKLPIKKLKETKQSLRSRELKVEASREASKEN